MRRFLAVLTLSLAAAVSVQANQTLSVATGGTGGVYYPLGGALAEMIGRYLPGYAGVAEVTGASVENMALIHRGDADIAFALADTVYQAYNGIGQFEGRRQIPATRALASVYPNAIQLVTLADSDIRSLQDLRGKRVSIGAPGSGTEVNVRTLLESNGIPLDAMRVQRLNFNETADALRDGDIEAGFWSVGPPTSSIMSLAASRPIRLLPLSDTDIATAAAVEPVFAAYTLRAGMYDGMDEAVQTIGIPNVLVVHADMDEELAYQLTRMIFENTSDLVAVHSAAEDLTLEFTLNSTPVPLHPGAVRYFREISAQIPERLIAP